MTSSNSLYKLGLSVLAFFIGVAGTLLIKLGELLMTGADRLTFESMKKK